MVPTPARTGCPGGSAPFRAVGAVRRGPKRQNDRRPVLGQTDVGELCVPLDFSRPGCLPKHAFVLLQEGLLRG